MRRRHGSSETARRSYRQAHRVLGALILVAIAGGPVLARSTSTLGMPDALAAQVAADPERAVETLAEVRRGGTLAGAAATTSAQASATAGAAPSTAGTAGTSPRASAGSASARGGSATGGAASGSPAAAPGSAAAGTPGTAVVEQAPGAVGTTSTDAPTPGATTPGATPPGATTSTTPPGRTTSKRAPVVAGEDSSDSDDSVSEGATVLSRQEAAEEPDPTTPAPAPTTSATTQATKEQDARGNRSDSRSDERSRGNGGSQSAQPTCADLIPSLCEVFGESD